MKRRLTSPRPLRVSLAWAFAGAAAGAAAASIAFAPAAWLAGAVASASGQQLLLADARGTVWSGSAVVVLTAGAGSQSAAALPGRLSWTLAPAGLGVELRLHQACCLRGQPRLALHRGGAELRPDPAHGERVGQWPASWLAGLGTPWNTLDLEGELRLATRGVSVDGGAAPRLDGQAVLTLSDASSRLSTLPVLGSYRLVVSGSDSAPTLALSTLKGALRLSANGRWDEGGVHLRGHASAAVGAERALDNLLNIIGRRDGARSILAIG